jgi:hypothetical protein
MRGGLCRGFRRRRFGLMAPPMAGRNDVTTDLGLGRWLGGRLFRWQNWDNGGSDDGVEDPPKDPPVNGWLMLGRWLGGRLFRWQSLDGR